MKSILEAPFKMNRDTIIIRDYVRPMGQEPETLTEYIKDLEELEVKDTAYALEVKNMRPVLAFVSNLPKEVLRVERSKFDAIFSKYQSEHTKNKSEEK